MQLHSSHLTAITNVLRHHVRHSSKTTQTLFHDTRCATLTSSCGIM